MIVRKGIKKDLPEVLELIKELAEYEKALDQVSNSVGDLKKMIWKISCLRFIYCGDRQQNSWDGNNFF